MLTLCVNRRNSSITQFSNYPYSSYANFNGQILATGEDGIYQVDTGNDDAGDNIYAAVEMPLSDFGSTSQKRLRRVHLGGEFAGGEMTVTTENREGNTRNYTATSPSGDESNIYADIGRDGKGRYWKEIISNIDGNDFSIDTVSVVVVPLSTRR